MQANLHLLVGVFGCAGLMIGTFLIDLDHAGSLAQKWDCFWHPHVCGNNYPEMNRGILHNNAVAFSLIAFSAMFAFGYLIHMLMDGIHLL